jgi:hypothetical protein
MASPSNKTMDLTSGIPTLAGIPPELKDRIVDYLDRKNIITVRLVSRDWAIAGGKQLFKDGMQVSLLFADMACLESVSMHPAISTSITNLTFNARGDEALLEGEHFLRGVLIGMKSTIETEEDRIKLAATLGGDETFSSILLKSYCNEQRLGGVFSLLPCIRVIEIAKHILAISPLYQSEDIHSRFDWPLPHTRRRATARNLDLCETILTISRYSSILSAIRNLTSPIEYLSLQALPVSFFVKHALPTSHNPSAGMAKSVLLGAYDDLKPAVLKKAMEKVKKLRLVVCGNLWEYDVMPAPPASLNIFGAMKGLCSLDLDWPMTDIPDHKFEAGMQKYLCSATFPCLESLRLVQTKIMDVKLHSFLKRHSATLRNLHLNSDGVTLSQDRTLRHLFTELRRDLNLKKFQYAPLPSEGNLMLQYDVNWNPYIRIEGGEKPKLFILEGSKARQIMISDGQLLEMFVLGKCTWPMETDSPDIDAASGGASHQGMYFFFGWRRIKMPGIYLEMEDKTDAQKVYQDLMEDERSYAATMSEDSQGELDILDILHALGI